VGFGIIHTVDRKGTNIMKEFNWLELFSETHLVEQLRKANEDSEKFGLVLTEQDIELIVAEKNYTLKEENRVEFGESIIPQIIREFCDSSYINNYNYTDTLIKLQNLFFKYKNEMEDEITDRELLNFMKQQYEEVCFGDIDFLEHSCLEVFAKKVRNGYRGFIATEGRGEFSITDEIRGLERDDSNRVIYSGSEDYD